jgi:hypothetical protein
MKLWVDSPNGGKAFEMGSEYKRKSHDERRLSTL